MRRIAGSFSPSPGTAPQLVNSACCRSSLRTALTVRLLCASTPADAKSWLFDDKIPPCFPAATASSVQQNAQPSLVHAEEFGSFAEGILTDERLWFVGVFSRLVDTYSIRDMGMVASYDVCLLHLEPPTLRGVVVVGRNPHSFSSSQNDSRLALSGPRTLCRTSELIKNCQPKIYRNPAMRAHTFLRQ